MLKDAKFLIIITALAAIFLAAPAHAGIISRAPTNLGLVGYWPMNEGTTTFVHDFSGKGNHGTTTNIAFPPTATSGWGDGRLGKAMRFDNSNDHISIPTFSFPSTYSSAVWLQWRAAFTNDVILGNDAATDAPLRITDTQVCFGGGCINHNGITPDLWYHFAISKSGNTISAYQNGRFLGLLAVSPDTETIQNIGSYGDGSFPFGGTADEVRIYNRALSATEVYALYKSGGVKHTNPSNLGLVGYWPMNEGTTTFVHDFSGNGNHGTTTNIAFPPTSTSGWTDGKMGKAMRFDGSNDEVIMASSSVFDFGTGNFTVSAWVYVRSYANEPDIVSKKHIAANGWALSCSSGGRVQLLIGDGSLFDSGRCTTEKWHHFVVERTGNSAGSIFVDNVYEAATPTLIDASDSATSGSVERIGSGVRSDGSMTVFEGKVDDVRVYNRALSATEVYALYKSGGVKHTNPSNLGLVGYWPMNEGTTTFVHDFSGNGNSGVMTGMNSLTDWVTGRLGKAIQFRNVGSERIIVSTSTLLTDLGPMTVSAWIYPRSLGGGSTGRIIGKGNSIDGTGFWIIRVGSTNTFRFTKDYSTTDLTRVAADNVYQLLKWSHIAVTWDGSSNASNVRLYVNGVETGYQTTTNGVDTKNSDSGQTLYIGNSASGSEFFGFIDEVRIYNRALNADEVRLLYLSR